MKRLLIIPKILFAAIFIFGGIAHFTKVDFYLSMMPDYLPYHLELVYISGAIELVLGALLLIPKYKTYSAYGIIALLVAVFPANIHMYLNAPDYPQMSETALIIRLPIQLLLILWAYAYTRKGQENEVTR